MEWKFTWHFVDFKKTKLMPKYYWWVRTEISRAEPSWGISISSWNRADNMYDINKQQILVPTPKLQSNFLIFINLCQTIDIFGVEYYNLGT